MKKQIYLAGGCYWGVQKYADNIRGVLETEVGFANGNTESPSYQQVRYENTGHAETVRVVYDPNVLPLKVLLNLFFKVIDPTSVDKQGGDVGHQYRTGIYFEDEKDGEIASETLKALSEKIGAPVAVECKKLDNFYSAEEYHQKYLDKNPTGYCHIPLQMIEWVKGVDPLAEI